MQGAGRATIHAKCSTNVASRAHTRTIILPIPIRTDAADEICQPTKLCRRRRRRRGRSEPQYRGQSIIHTKTMASTISLPLPRCRSRSQYAKIQTLNTEEMHSHSGASFYVVFYLQLLGWHQHAFGCWTT